jgi:hypothetical protein
VFLSLSLPSCVTVPFARSPLLTVPT